MGDQLNQSRYDQLLRRVGDLKGPGSKVSTVLEDVFPVIELENVPIELLLLMGTRVAFGQRTSAGVLVDQQRIQLFNPLGSQQLGTITSVHIRSDTAQEILYGISALALEIDPATQRFRDSRLGLSNRPVCEIRFDGDTATTPVQASVFVEADVDLHLWDPKGIAVLSEDFGLTFTTTTLNTLLSVSILWQERVAEPSELNF